MDEYYINVNGIGNSLNESIHKEYYERLVTAKNILTSALSIEEKYEIFIRNYYELEKELLCISLQKMLSRVNDDSCVFDKMISIDLRVMNLLSSARAYIDHGLNELTNIGDGSKCNPMKNWREKYKKENASFYFVEHLRNHVQHKGLAVHNITSQSKWIENFKSLEHSCTFIVKKNILEKNLNFCKRALNNMQDEIDLFEYLREYVGVLSVIHDSIRNEISSVVDNSRLIIETAIEDYSNKFNWNSVGLTAQHSKSGTIIDSVVLQLNWDDVRLELRKKNRPLKALEKQHITGKLTEQR